MKQFQTYEEDRIKSLKVVYNEHEKDMVEGMRLNITSFLLQCETSTVNETREHAQYTVNEMREEIRDLLAHFEKSTVKEKKEELTLNIAPIMSLRNSCIRLHNELLQLHVAIQKVLGRWELSVIASIKCTEKIQHCKTYLIENFPNHVFSVGGKSEYNVKMPGDPDICLILAVCVLPNGQVLVADYNNKKVKLLNQQYQVVSHWHVGGYPRGLCQIPPREVAVTVDDYRSTHEVHFITVHQSKLVPHRKFQFEHRCRGIAHHQGDLFIASGTALYNYSLSGKLVCRLYADVSDECTVDRCAVSPIGDKLYITQPDQHKLLTLARDGTVLATYTHPLFQSPSGVHVTPGGQVLVCAWLYPILLQVDSEGRRAMIDFCFQNNAVWKPMSVCYSSTTSSIIVGQMNNNNILVIKVE